MVAVAVGSMVQRAEAALCVRSTLRPATPEVGQTSTYELRTFAPIARGSGGFQLKASPIPRSYPFRVVAVSPRNKRLLLHIQEQAGRSGLWAGRITFPVPGHWVIHVENFDGPGVLAPHVEPRCYSPLPVTVRAASMVPSHPSGADHPFLFAVVALSALALAAAVLVWLRSRAAQRRTSEGGTE